MNESGVVIRPILPADDPAVAAIVREVLGEFGGGGAGFSSEDAEVDAMSAAYSRPGAVYFVVEVDGELAGGGGIGPLAGAPADVCELRKMYLRPAVRGRGVGLRLLESCTEAARAMEYRICYLETLANMDRARDLYERFGFLPLEAPMGDTGHFGCNRWYALSL